jgi:hypothetical protein
VTEDGDGDTPCPKLFESVVAARVQAEMWKLYFGVVKGLLLAITSVVYLVVLTAFFIAQQAVLVAGKITGSVIDWSPEKPRVFGMRPVNGE